MPFGDFKLYDRKHNAMEFKVHDHFIAKSIDHVRPGGIVAVITTKGTLDKQNSTVRKYLAQRAELIGAIRLPNTAFKADAGTEVTSDILFFQKRERKIVAEPDWVHLGLTEDKIPVNSYFVEHPEMILGYMIRDTGRFGENSNLTACVNDDPDFDLQEALSRAVSNIHAQITDFERTVEEGEEPEEYLPADPDVKNFTYTFIDGVLYFRKDSRMVRQEVGDKVLERIKGMDAIRTATRHLIDIQLSGCSEQALRQAQEELNTVYDQFTKKYGYITAKGNARAFRDDGDYPLLCSLEMVDEDGVVSKADMFTRQTIKAKQAVDHVETAVEALNVSVNEFNGVNIAFMISIYQPDLTLVKEKLAKENNTTPEEIHFSDDLTAELSRTKLIEELNGLIFLNPMEYNEHDPDHGWETADEYLSGNVRDKLRLANAVAKEHPEMFADNVTALEQVQPKDLDAYNQAFIKQSLSADELEMLQYYLSSGVYGTFERMVTNRMDKQKKANGKKNLSKLSYYRHRVFPGMELYENYPLLVKHKWLIPAYWCYRIVRLLFSKKRRDYILCEVKAVEKVAVHKNNTEAK